MTRILRVFPRWTSMTPRDSLAFVGGPPLWRPLPDEIDEVHVSVTFTWDKHRAERLAEAWARHYSTVKLGGPAYDDPGGEFVPGRYLKPGVTITTRGCPRRCGHCFVPQREGPMRELEALAPGHVVEDNNLLAASRAHLDKVWSMLEGQSRIELSGGLDARLLNDGHLDALSRLRKKIRQLFFAYDLPGQLEPVRKALKSLAECGFSRRKLRCYVLIGQPGDTLEKAQRRLEETWEAGALPFAMVWRGKNGDQLSHEWRKFGRKWMRPAAMFATHGVDRMG